MARTAAVVAVAVAMAVAMAVVAVAVALLPCLSGTYSPVSLAHTPLSLWHTVMVSPWRDRDVFSHVQGVNTYSSGAAAIGGYSLTEADWNLFKL